MQLTTWLTAPTHNSRSRSSKRRTRGSGQQSIVRRCSKRDATTMETIAQTEHQGTEQDSQTTAVALQGPACEPSRENVLNMDNIVQLFLNQLEERLEGWLNGGSFLTFHSRYTSVHIFRRRIITFHGIWSKKVKELPVSYAHVFIWVVRSTSVLDNQQCSSVMWSLKASFRCCRWLPVIAIVDICSSDVSIYCHQRHPKIGVSSSDNVKEGSVGFYCENITFYLSLYFCFFWHSHQYETVSCFCCIYQTFSYYKHILNIMQIYIFFFTFACFIVWNTNYWFLFFAFLALLNCQHSTRWSILSMYSLNTWTVFSKCWKHWKCVVMLLTSQLYCYSLLIFCNLFLW